MTERIIVPFAGEGSGADALSWGQAEIWRAMERQRSWIPLITIARLPAGTIVGDITAQLRLRMSRYPSMRTRYHVDPGGTPRQVLAAGGEAALEIIDADGDPAETAAAVRGRYLVARPDLASDWPLQMTAIRHRGTLTHLVTAVCHLAVDAFGTAAMLDELATLDPHTGPAAPPPDGLTPLDQARWQHSPAGQRVSNAAMRHWRSLLATAPPRRFPTRAVPRRPRYAEISFCSPALHLAARTVAARTSTGTAPVLLAAFAAALARVTGSNPALARIVVSNRFRPGLGKSVSQVAQTGLCVIDVAGITFDEAVKRAWRMSLTASRNAYYDPAHLDELVARLSAERGAEIEVGCFYNDRRMGDDSGQEAIPSQADITAALPRTTLRFQPPTDLPTETFFLHVNDVPGTIDITASADTAHISPEDTEMCVRGMEEIVAAAVCDPAFRHHRHQQTLHA
jgi:hypothetical protein